MTTDYTDTLHERPAANCDYYVMEWSGRRTGVVEGQDTGSGVSEVETKPIKTRKTSNKSYSYNLLNRINKMYTHDLFYLQQEWEAWLAPSMNIFVQLNHN